MSFSDQVAVATLVVTILVGIVTVGALVVAVVTLRRTDRSSSAAALIALNSDFRECWKLVDATRDDFQYHLAELMNVCEIACALHCEGTLTGVSRELVEQYAATILELIEDSPDARHQLISLRDKPDTFKYIKKFLVARRIKYPTETAQVSPMPARILGQPAPKDSLVQPPASP